MTTIDLLQNILWTALLFVGVFGALFATLFFATDLDQKGADPWIIPAALTFVCLAISVLAFVGLGAYLILYAIWN